MTKKFISLETDAYLDFDGDNINEVINKLEKLKETYGEDAWLDYSQDDYSDHYSYTLMVKSIETDEAYKRRLAKEEQAVAYRKEHYERLKKEFG
jgi:hypothetical protein